jgi:hypothetical protein
VEHITRDFELPANADTVRRLWRRLERNAILRGALEAHFERLSGGRTRVAVSTAYEADGRNRSMGKWNA